MYHLIQYSETGRGGKDYREVWAQHAGTLREARESALRLRKDERDSNPRFAVFVDNRRIR